MNIDIVKADKGYSLFGTFEIGNSGVIERRLLVTRISKRKAELLKEKYEHKH